MLIPVVFARLCITFHLSRNENYLCRTNFESLTSMRNFREFSSRETANVYIYVDARFF